MSQFFIQGSGGAPPPPGTVGFLSGQIGSNPVGPDGANNINIFAEDTTDNVDNGTQTRGDSATNTVYVQITNRQTATVTTANATPVTLLTFAMPSVAGTYYIYGNVQAFTSTGPAGGAYSFSAGYLTNGATSTELGTEFHDTFQSASLLTSDIALSASGNNAILTVTGVAGLTINWNALLEFRQVN